MTVDLENILEVPLKDFLGLRGQHITEYVLVGVHVSGPGAGIEDFASKIPEGTEVVVGFTHSTSSAATAAGGYRKSVFEHAYAASGTALIPKKLYDKMQRDNPLKEQ